MDVKIERYEVITVKSAVKNSYGDLVVNGGIKIGKKRENIFPVFQLGAEVNLGYASYMNKEYVATAEQTGKHEVPSLVDAAKSMGAELANPPLKGDRFNPEYDKYPPERLPQPIKSTPVKEPANDRIKSMALSYSKDLAVAGKIRLEEINTYADKFIEYILK
jgi:hypothetical protein